MERSEKFKILLAEKFESLIREKGKYSMRAFAQYLGIDVAALHHILNGKRKVGKKMIVRLGPKIGLGISEIEELINEK